MLMEDLDSVYKLIFFQLYVFVVAKAEVVDVPFLCKSA